MGGSIAAVPFFLGGETPLRTFGRSRLRCAFSWVDVSGFAQYFVFLPHVRWKHERISWSESRLVPSSIGMMGTTPSSPPSIPHILLPLFGLTAFRSRHPSHWPEKTTAATRADWCTTQQASRKMGRHEEPHGGQAVQWSPNRSVAPCPNTVLY